MRFACDPRIPNTAAQQKWWRWATEEAKRTAIDALAGLTISEFLALLDDSLSSSNQRRQFKRRKLCLLQMLKEGLIADARLVIHDSVYSHLDSSILKSLMPEVVRGGGQKASFICLRCINDVFLIEGTHNFALRGLWVRLISQFADFGQGAAEPITKTITFVSLRVTAMSTKCTAEIIGSIDFLSNYATTRTIFIGRTSIFK